MWEFLEDFDLLQAADGVEEVLLWDQVYACIASHENLIRALLTPASSPLAYYRDLAHQARLAGINDPDLMFALLWHAPQGDVRTSPERLSHIRKLAATATATDNGKRVAPPGGSSSAPVTDLPVAAPSQTAPTPVNDLVEFMENRVVLDRSRYESMIYELAELTAKAEALQRRLEEWERLYDGRQPTAAVDSLTKEPTAEMAVGNFAYNHPMSSTSPEVRKPQLTRLKAVVQDFLKNNADLADNEEAVRMLQFCLRNYIDLNPELNALPLGTKLEMAGKMAREFMSQLTSREATENHL
ncbi:MAG: hypothetical protein ACUVXF_02610 [Desulfobaccales bacterium]